MNAQQRAELFAIIRANLDAFYVNPSNFVPFGTERLSTYALKIFDAEMDKAYYFYETTR